MRRIISTILLASLFVIPCLTNADISLKDDDLLLYLPFNGDTEDYSKNENHGELVGSADFVEGKYGEALAFSETGEVRCPHIPMNEKFFTFTVNQNKIGILVFEYIKYWIWSIYCSRQP